MWEYEELENRTAKISYNESHFKKTQGNKNAMTTHFHYPKNKFCLMVKPY